MSRIYYYKLTADNGGAPCIVGDWLSLAICKPRIRSTAQKGSLVFGFAADSLHPDNRLIYISCITEKLHDGAYYKSKEYAARQDCIYEWRDERYQWKPGSLHHGPNDVEHDLGKTPYAKANVLLSNDFRYFGKDGSAAYKTQMEYALIREAVEKLGRGHRVHHPDGLREQLLQMKAQMWRVPQKLEVTPSREPQRGVCHRSKSCGEIQW